MITICPECKFHKIAGKKCTTKSCLVKRAEQAEARLEKIKDYLDLKEYWNIAPDTDELQAILKEDSK